MNSNSFMVLWGGDSEDVLEGKQRYMEIGSQLEVKKGVKDDLENPMGKHKTYIGTDI